MRYNLGALVTILLTIATKICYKVIDNQHDHFKNVSSNPYVLAIFIDSIEHPEITVQLKNSLELLDNAETIKDNKVLIELIDTSKLPFFEKHYKLKGKPSVKLFIRSQMVTYDNFYSELQAMRNNSKIDIELPIKLLAFVDLHLKNISVEVRDVNHFREMLNDKKVLGYFCCAKDNTFDDYFKIAGKNIDFNFVHSFDTNTNERIFKEVIQFNSPQNPFFAIIRHKDILNDFDKNQVVTITDLGQKALTEFIEFERFDKLRDPATGNDILKRMFTKSQPLLLYIKEKDQDTKSFEIFKEAVKALPKQFIYTYTEIDSPTSGPFLQLFMMVDKMMTPETLSIIWVTPARSVKIESYQGAFEKDRIIEFVAKFHKQNENIIHSMREHLYDNGIYGNNEGIMSEEL